MGNFCEGCPPPSREFHGPSRASFLVSPPDHATLRRPAHRKSGRFEMEGASGKLRTALSRVGGQRAPDSSSFVGLRDGPVHRFPDQGINKENRARADERGRVRMTKSTPTYNVPGLILANFSAKVLDMGILLVATYAFASLFRRIPHSYSLYEVALGYGATSQCALSYTNLYKSNSI